jgi:hypothetical protein
MYLNLETVSGIAVSLQIVFMPQGIVGTLQRIRIWRRSKAEPVAAQRSATT